MMRIGSLCTGYGGIDLAAAAWYGAHTVWTSDIDPGASKIIAHRYPAAPNLGDLTRIDWATVPRCDILTAGYPCQPFSAAGRRKGTNDHRHLWPYIRDAIRHLRPTVTLLENVAGHRSLGFDRVLGDMAEDGLHARWVSVRASDVGAPHTRERVFIAVTDPRRVRSETGGVAASGEAKSGWPLPISGVGSRVDPDADSHSEPLRLEPVGQPRRESAAVAGRDSPSPADTTTRGPLRLADRPGIEGARGSGERHSAGDDRLSTDADGRSSDSLGATLQRAAAARSGEEPPTHAESKRRRKGRTQPEGIPRRPDPALSRAQDWGIYEAAIRRWERVTGRIAPRPVEQTRRGAWRLSPWFDEWLMGLPEGWICDTPGLSWNEALAAAGNGVVWQQAYAALDLLDQMQAPAARDLVGAIAEALA